jgi:hypothetical protein
VAGRRERRERALSIAAEHGVAEASRLTGVSEVTIAGWVERAAGVRPARAKRADVATRRRAVARAGQVGDAKAAEEFGVALATIRSWRRRVAGEPPGPAPSERDAEGAGVAASARSAEDGSLLGGMRAALARARAVEDQASEQAQTLLAAGQAREAQAASIAGGVWSDKSRALEKAIAAAEAEGEAEQSRLQRGTLELAAGLLSATFTALDLPVPVETIRALAACADAGEELMVPAEVAAEDRELVRARVRADVLPEVEAELAAQRQEDQPAERVAGGDAEGDGDGEWSPHPGSWREGGQAQAPDGDGEPMEPDAKAIREGRAPVIPVSEIRQSIRAAYPQSATGGCPERADRPRGAVSAIQGGPACGELPARRTAEG